MKKLNKKEQLKYEKDFPVYGNFNWRLVKLKNMPCDQDYLNGTDLLGVLLYDDKFMYRGHLFEINEFEIVDENPIGLTDKIVWMKKNYHD